ncbi:hypothetical protein GUG90_18070, partial [Xanthomonas citri pv. citri]|nr:hypothetical protein [Xanthomonas citri pv. citri]
MCLAACRRTWQPEPPAPAARLAAGAGAVRLHSRLPMVLREYTQRHRLDAVAPADYHRHLRS